MRRMAGFGDPLAKRVQDLSYPTWATRRT